MFDAIHLVFTAIAALIGVLAVGAVVATLALRKHWRARGPR